MSALLAYHQETKHSPESVRRSGHRMDWASEPQRFKEYPGLEPVPLPPLRPTGVSLHDALEASAIGRGGPLADLETLSHLLFHGAGVVRTIRRGSEAFHFRTYACAGALYPIEVYVVTGGVEGLGAGVYHYGPREHALRPLRSGDLRGSLGLAGEPPGDAALVLTGIPWRTEWKYGPRGFRHLYWDAGMVVANLLAAVGATGVRARALMGFSDPAVQEVLGIDGRTEVPLCVVSVGEAASAPEPGPMDDQVPRSVPGWRDPDPLTERARAAVVLSDDRAVRDFRGTSSVPRGVRGSIPVEPLPRELLSDDPVERVIRRRGSSRRLAREAMPAAEFEALARRALAPLPGDWTSAGVRPRVIASALEGLEPGVYVPGNDGPTLARPGDLRRLAGYLCLEQRLGADAAATTFLTVDLPRALRSSGERGYASAQLEAAVVAGRMYLGAYAQCLGASGITFYDDEVRRAFGTEDEPMLAVVVGPEGHRASIRRCREERRPEPEPA